MKDKFLYI